MELLNFNIIKLTTCLVLGILIGNFIRPTLTVSFYLTSLLLTLLFVFLLLSKKQFKKTVGFGVVGLVATISIGILTISFHNQKSFSNHYTQKLTGPSSSLNLIKFRVREVLKSGRYYDKYIIDIISVNNENVTGKSLLNIEKDSLAKPIYVDDVYITKTEFKDLIPPLNPYQFDYKKHLEKEYIYQQLFIHQHALFKIDGKDKTLLGIANNIRQYINKKLKPYNFQSNEIAIINALLLGQRQDITKTVYNSYTNAGAIHILAVSGLHVGIILLILNFIFKPLEQFRYGKLIKTIILVCFLWCFALIAGLSASVTRAVTMFSIVAIAMNINRPTNIYNTLAISILVILLFKPLFLFDVGFQLSYLAVFAIVTIDPYLYKLWQPKTWVLDKLWHTFTITLSAQFGILPISLYYFHQFPSLFFVSNLVIIPLLGIILGLGILVITLAVFNILPPFVAEFYGCIIDSMNSFVNWVSQQESFLFKDIPFSLLHIFVSYLFIITLIRFFIKKNYNALKLLLVAVLIVQFTLLYTKHSKPFNTFIIFHQSRHSLIGQTNPKKIIIAHDFDSLTSSENRLIKDYAMGRHINTIEETLLKPVYQLNQEKLMIVDSSGIYNVKSFRPDYILLRQSPKINLKRLIDSIKPKEIIADGSNYKSYVERWSKICKDGRIPFHQTSKKGAYIIKY
ncbi:ComEC/Rec2 family competence protein [uncultured Algibacter sp.]|uniref:ComEC/Rec2 family competence protein n=1 Tax=uncultured Algibacter sp. TaxID=298659 RepID=UPI002608BF86|nr:ComEC/Rec2 family competence protein [uncultured Algibacter sp.]